MNEKVKVVRINKRTGVSLVRDKSGRLIVSHTANTRANKVKNGADMTILTDNNNKGIVL